MLVVLYEIYVCFITGCLVYLGVLVFAFVVCCFFCGLIFGMGCLIVWLLVCVACFVWVGFFVVFFY